MRPARSSPELPKPVPASPAPLARSGRRPGRLPTGGGPQRALAALVASASAAAVVAALVGAPAATAQDAARPGGPRLTFGFDTELRLSDDPRPGDEREGETALLSETDLGFGYESITRLQVLRLGASGTLRELVGGGDGAEEDAGFTGPDLTFAYGREGVGSRFGVTASHEVRDLTFALAPLEVLDPDDPFVDPNAFIQATGTRRTTRAGVELVLFENRPFGVELDAATRRIDYSEDEATFDESRAAEVNGALRFDLTPLLTARLIGGYEQVDFEGQDDRRERSAALALSYEISPVLTARAALGQSVSTFDDGEEEREEEGIVGGAGVVYELPRGTVELSYERRLDFDETRDSISLARSFVLPGEDALRVRIGASKVEDGDTVATGGLQWRRVLPRGAVAVSVDREVVESLEGDLVTLTDISASWTRQINALSGVILEAEYGRISDTGDDDGDDSSEAGLLRAALTRDLTADWRLSGGVEGRLRDDETRGVVFVGLSRLFEIRP